MKEMFPGFYNFCEDRNDHKKPGCIDKRVFNVDDEVDNMDRTLQDGMSEDDEI